MKLIPLTRGLFAKVDDEDYEILSNWNWYATYYGYAARQTRKSEGPRRIIYMHR